MRERPILFSSPMVRAILAGTKSQTRRVVKPYDPVVKPGAACPVDLVVRKEDGFMYRATCPYGQPGDRLWVRETCRADELPSGLDGVRYLADESFLPIENTEAAAERWGELACYGMKNSGRAECRTVPSIHMPRWASRILLEITGVRVERLNDISEADALDEGITVENVIVGTTHAGGYHQEIHADRYYFDGCDEDGFESAGDAYAALWELINGPGSWAANPWVWVIEFKQLKGGA